MAWLTYDQKSRWVLSVAPQSPVLAAHQQLNEWRFLSPEDLSAFSVQAAEEGDGQPNGTLVKIPFAAAVARTLDPRLERIARQQYLKFAVVRRDARFAFCGTAGTLVLSGNELKGARTPEALRPIQRRLSVWILLVLVVLFGSRLLISAVGGKSPYFAVTNDRMALLGWLGILLAVPFIGGALRALRPGWSFGALRGTEKGAGAGAIVMFALIPVLGLTTRPSSAEVDRALANGDVGRAKEVVDALKERAGPAGAGEAEDAVALAEARTLAGDAKLTLLDSVAARHGAKATEALSAARTERFAEVGKLLDAKSPDAAITALNRWFPAGATDRDVVEVRAKAEDLAASICSDDPCRVRAAAAAKATAPTPAREASLNASRNQLLLALATVDVLGEDPLVHVKRLRALSSAAARTLEFAASDPGLVDKATKAGEWARHGLDAVPMLGSQLAVAEELLGGEPTTMGKGSCIGLDGTTVCFSVDAQGRCRGVYVVGASKGSRRIRGTTWTVDRIVSQAVGRPATVGPPVPPTAAVSRAFPGGVPVVGRRNGGDLWEVRIGDAAP